MAAVQDVPTANAEKRKHSQTTMATDIDDGAQPTKKSKPGTKKTPMASKSGQKRMSARKPAQPATKRVLPSRGGRNEHPGAVNGAGPAPRRKAHEVQAERAAKQKATEDQMQQEAQAKTHLAEWQLAEEEEDDEMEAESFKRCMKIVRKQQEVDESSGKEFELLDEAGLSSQDELVSKQPVEVSIKFEVKCWQRCSPFVP
jgi:hypothetical protein